nr:helix-turn-helix transcriptional regulator [Nocardioides panzhihuensis]
MIHEARVAARLTQEALARRAGTTQSTLSAYERGAKSPTLAVTERILRSIGYDLALTPQVTFREVEYRAFTWYVPIRLWRLDLVACFTPVTIRDQSGKSQDLDLATRPGRINAYQWLLEHGTPEQIFNHLDGALLVDAWNDLTDLPAPLRVEWQPLVEHAYTDMVDALLIRGLRDRYRQKTPSLRAQTRHLKHLVQRLADRGLNPDEILQVLRTRR